MAVLVLRDFGYGSRDGQGSTSLMLAAQYGNVEIMKLLIEREQRLRDYQGRTALYWAAKNNKLEAVQLLLPLEAKIPKNGGSTALMIAAQEGHLEIVKLLMHAEAGLQNAFGFTALMCAITNGHQEVACSLIPQEMGYQTVPRQNLEVLASAFGQQQIADYIKEYQALCEERIRGRLKLTLLQRAVEDLDWGTIHQFWEGEQSEKELSRIEIARIKAMQKPCVCGGAGSLDEAVDRNCAKCIVRLNEKITGDKRPELRAISGLIQMRKLRKQLFDFDVLPEEEATLIYDQSPLTAAIILGHVDCVLVLLRPNKLKTPSIGKLSALMYAVIEKQPAVTKLLRDGEIKLLTETGQSVYDIGGQYGPEGCLAALEE